MAITQTTLLGEGVSVPDGTSWTTSGSISPTGDRLVVACAFTVSNSQPGTVPTLTGGGMTTWDQIVTAQQNRATQGYRATIFRALQASPGSGTLTVDCGADVQTSWGLSISEFSDIDTGGTNGSAAIVQNNSNQSASSNNFTVTLSAFGDASNNVALGAVIRDGNGTDLIVKESAFTEIHELRFGTESRRFQTQWYLGEDTSVNWTWTTAQECAGAAIEIKAAAAPAPSALIVPIIREV